MFGADEMDDVVERLRDWLDRTQQELDDPAVAAFQQRLQEGDMIELPEGLVGLLQVVEGFCALRGEMKLQTKSVRNLREELQAAVGRLDEAAQQHRQASAEAESNAVQATRPLLESLADVDELVANAHDALAGTLDESQQQVSQDLVSRIDAQFQRLPRWRKALYGPWQREICRLAAEQAGPRDSALQSIAEGVRLLRSRLTKSLVDVHLERIECVGRQVDPQSMRVVDVIEDAERKSETVVEEIRPGYRHRGKVIRCAEVRATRRPA